MSARIKCPVCFHHVPPDSFCPRCTRLNISEQALEILLKGLDIKQIGPGPLRPTKLERRWVARSRLILAAILYILGFFLGSEFTARIASSDLSALNSFWPLLFYGAGSFSMLYLALALTLNTTKMEITPEKLQVRRGPLRVPLAPSWQLDVKDVKRVDLYRSVDNESDEESYELTAVDRKGESFDLFEFHQAEEAMAWYNLIKNHCGLEERMQSSTIKRVLRHPAPHVETISAIYRTILPASFALNLPAILLVEEWLFDDGYWFTFSLFTLAIYLVMNFHHRKHLNVWDSHPLEADEEQVGPIFYGVVTLIYCLLLTPFAMLIYNFYLLRWTLFTG